MKVTRAYLSIFFMLSFVLMAYAQPGPGRGEGRGWRGNNEGFQGRHMNLPNLTDEQKDQIAKLRTENMKTMLQNRNLLQEKMAKLNTLQTADKPDMKAINTLIDETAALKATMAKAQAAHRQQVRSLLTDEQRVIFDSRPHRGWGEGPGKGFRGKGQGKGNCPCRQND